MFNNNLTKTYNFQDASQEIVIMLLGAFLLGCLLTWLLNKLFNKDYSVQNNAYRYENKGSDEINSLKQVHNTPQANTTSEARVVDKPTNPSKSVLAADDLTKISGIDTDMKGELEKIGIKSFTDLRDIKANKLTTFQQKQQTHKREIETWPHQASLAAKGDWNKLKDYQGFIQRVQIASDTTKQTEDKNADDLKKLIGISPAIESILNKKEITTFKQLSHIDSDTLKNHIIETDSHFADTETESWPHQAAMAEKGQWEELKIYQEFMHADSDVTAENSLKSKSSPLNIQSIEAQTNTKSESEVKTPNKNTKIEEENLSDHDDLRKIEGVGPKIEEVLNNGGIYTFSQLYKSDRNRLRSLLDDAGNQFRMHDPESWPHQAGMADRSEWDELKTYQNSINKSQTISSLKAETAKQDNTEHFIPKNVSKIKAPQQPDDLRKIEGIGPKIQELLNHAGIMSYLELSKSSSDSIKKLLNEAGPQFRMHEPESWPHQAKLASDNEWDELKEYQDFLISSRE